MERDRREEMKVVRSRLMREDCLPLWAMVMSRPRMLPRLMSGSLVLQHPGSECMSVATKGHVGAQEPYRSWGHTDMNGTYYYLVPWQLLARAAAGAHVWLH